MNLVDMFKSEKVDGEVKDMRKCRYKEVLMKRKEQIEVRMDGIADRLFDPELHDVRVLQRIKGEYDALGVKLAKIEEEIAGLSKTHDENSFKLIYDFGLL